MLYTVYSLLDSIYIAGNFSVVGFSRAEQSTRKLKLLPRTGISHAKIVVGGFSALNTNITTAKIYSEGLSSHSAKCGPSKISHYTVAKCLHRGISTRGAFIFLVVRDQYNATHHCRQIR